mgnify:CR=1 FL=1
MSSLPKKGQKSRGAGAKKAERLTDGFYNDPHPYGVQPSGNAYFCSPEESQVRPRGLGRVLSALTDEALLEMLGFLTAPELAACSVSSKVLYVYAHHSDLWRDLTLRRWEGLPLAYQSSWKETYMSLGKAAQGAAASGGTTAARHVAISVRGVFSNLLHRAWSCHTCDLARCVACVRLQGRWLSRRISISTAISTSPRPLEHPLLLEPDLHHELELVKMPRHA